MAERITDPLNRVRAEADAIRWKESEQSHHVRAMQAINRDETWRPTDEVKITEELTMVAAEAERFDYQEHKKATFSLSTPQHPDPHFLQSPSALSGRRPPPVRADSEFTVPRVSSDDREDAEAVKQVFLNQKPLPMGHIRRLLDRLRGR